MLTAPEISLSKSVMRLIPLVPSKSMLCSLMLDAPTVSRSALTSTKKLAPHNLFPFFHPSNIHSRSYLARLFQRIWYLTSYSLHFFDSDFSNFIKSIKIMPPKAAEKKPSTGGKAPAGKAPAEKKEAGKKTAAPAGEKKKRNKTRKETYSSYIYKGSIRSLFTYYLQIFKPPV